MFNRQIGARKTGCFSQIDGMRSNEARGGPVRRFPDRSAAETASHYSGEFRSPFSRWGLSGKLRPTLKRQNGMRFPVEASSGKRIPESVRDWDAISRSSPSGKLRPRICARNGTRFPRGPKQPPAPRQNDPFPSVPEGSFFWQPRQHRYLDADRHYDPIREH